MNTALMYGLYVTAANIVFNLIMYFTGAWKSESYGWLGFLTVVFLAIGIVFAMRERKREEFDGYLRYAQGFSTGLTVSIVAGLLGAIFYYVYLNYINPEVVDFMREQMEKGMAEQQREMSSEQFEQAKDMGELFMTPSMQAIWTFVTTLVVGSIISLIAAAFLKRNPEPQVMG